MGFPLFCELCPATSSPLPRCPSTPPPPAPPMASPETPSVLLVFIHRSAGPPVASAASETTKNTQTVSIRRSLAIWEPKRSKKTHGASERPRSRKVGQSTLLWTDLERLLPDLPTTRRPLQPPKKQKLRKTFLTGNAGCWSGRRKTRRRRKKKKPSRETLALSQAQHYIPHMSTNHMTPIPVSLAGAPPPTSELPLIPT